MNNNARRFLQAFKQPMGTARKAAAALLVFGLVLSGCSRSSQASSSVHSSAVSSMPASSASKASSHSQAESASSSRPQPGSNAESQETPAAASISLDQIPPYSNQPYVVINNNQPFFEPNELTADSFQHYFDLDALGRATLAYGSIGQDLMPTEKRGDISSVHPTGWHQQAYSFIKDGGMVYNRSHLIAYSLAGQNANPKNLITGTRYFNATGMEPFESQVRDYVKETGNHVMYRITPMYSGNDLVARGVLMEAKSVEDQGEGIEFCIFVYNVQPGVVIDYATGYTHAANTQPADPAPSAAPPASTESAESFTPADSAQNAQSFQSANPAPEQTYVLNTKTKKFHLPDCPSVEDMTPGNRQDVQDTREDLIQMGYAPCKRCNP